MEIIKESILDYSDSPGPIEDLSIELSTQAGVSLTVRRFDYVINSRELEPFELNAFKTVFPEFLESDYVKKKSGNYVEGTLKLVSFEESKAWIDLHIFCGGIDARPISKGDVCEYLKDEAESNVQFFWEEVEKHFKLPPSRVYRHDPEANAAFSGVFWNFCFIYLNDATGQGIVLAGEAFD